MAFLWLDTVGGGIEDTWRAARAGTSQATIDYPESRESFGGYVRLRGIPYSVTVSSSPHARRPTWLCRALGAPLSDHGRRASATWSTSSFPSYHGQLLSLAVQWGVAIEIERAVKKSARFC